jgi:integrase
MIFGIHQATYWLNDPEMTTTEVQHRLGHRSQSTTTNIYGYVLKKKKDRATEMMEGLKDHIESKESLPKIN